MNCIIHEDAFYTHYAFHKVQDVFIISLFVFKCRVFDILMDDLLFC